jgi:predicted DNA repair protein MutK
MAGGSLLLLLDDIASVLDDVALLGKLAAAPFGTRVAVPAGIALATTIGVYGLVAGIVKLDDLGLWLSRRLRSA